MSLCYWTVEGVGICESDFESHIDDEKVLRILKEKFPDKNPEDIENMYAEDGIAFFYDAAQYCELLSALDNTGCFIWGTDGDCENYLVYPPKHPWDISENDPKTLQETRHRLACLIMMITDYTYDQALNIIDNDVYVNGCS